MMKRYLYILFTLVLVSCGVSSNHFKIEGKFRNLNQGEFYVYSPDGGLDGMDTIKVQSGEFTYEVPLDKPATFILVFPNFSEQPVFAEPGVTAKMNGDASHLKEVEVSGSDDNELMTKFTKNILRLSPPEIMNAVTGFVKDNPESRVGNYLVSRYILQATSPDYSKATQLLDLMIKNQPGNGDLIQTKTRIKYAGNGSKNMLLPKFSATTINGGKVTDNDLRGKYAVINVWSSWNYDSQNNQRQLLELKKKYSSRLALMSISLDFTAKICKESMDRDSIKWNTVCDGMIWDGPLLKTLGIGTVPDNILVGPNGKIIARGLDASNLKIRLESLLK